MANTELAQFVAAERMRGVADDAIEKSLVEKGWRAEDVAAALLGKAPEHTGGFSFTHLFEGRMGRMDYLLTQLLLCVLVAFVAGASFAMLFNSQLGWGAVIGAMLTILLLALLSLPFSFGITVRRLHDVGASGWFVLLTFVPAANFIMWLALLFIPGNAGANLYGMPAGKRSVMSALLNT